IVATHLDCSVVRLGSRAVKLRVRIYSPDYPRVAGIKRSGVSPLAEPSYCRSLRSGPSDSRLSSGPIIFIRLSRIDWLWSAKRASVWVTGGSPLPGQLGGPTHAHLHHRQ